MPSDTLNLQLNANQALLLESFDKFFAQESSPQDIHTYKNGFNHVLWRKLIALGLQTLRVPETYGGAGASLLDHMLIAELVGKHLVCAPVCETIIANHLLSCLQNKTLSYKQIESQIVEDGATLTLALHPVIAGQQQIIPMGAVAQYILALDGERVLLYQTPTVSQAAAVSSLASLAAFELDQQPFHLVAEGPQARLCFLSAVEEWKLSVAANLSGTTNQALHLAAKYSAERQQFGRKIGSFQGLAHPLADAAVDIDGAKLLIWQAISSIANNEADAGAKISMASWWARHTSLPAVECALRTFGGYGVSLESDVHHFYSRVKSLRLIAGDPERELDTIASRLWQQSTTSLPPAGDVGIQFQWGPKAETYTQHLRQFIQDNLTGEIRAIIHHSTKGHSKPFAQKLAQAGLLFPDLPTQYGGEERTLYEVSAAKQVWEHMDWNRTACDVTEFVLKMALEWGTESLKQELIPLMMSGRAVGCLGFTEPESGSDIFGAQLRATFDGTQWRLNGQKLFTTAGHIADYILLLTRTSNEGPKHQGLTVFILPMNTPGIEVHPIETLQDERTNITYFTDVIASDHYRLGEVDQGFAVMHTALELEHGGIIYHHALTAMLSHALEWAKQPDSTGDCPLRNKSVGQRLAHAFTIAAVSEGLARRSIWAVAAKQNHFAYGPMAKLFATEGLRKTAADIVSLSATESLLMNDSHVHFIEVAMRRALAMTIYGGTSEIHRSMIAEQLLKMPKSRS